MVTQADISLEPDWELAQQLYIQQVPCTEICARIGVKYNTLMQRVKRQRWVMMRRAAKVPTVSVNAFQTNDFGKLSNSTRLELGYQVAKFTREGSSLNTKRKVSFFRDKAEAMLTVGRLADLTFGWSEQDRIVGMLAQGEVEDIIEQKGKSAHLKGEQTPTLDVSAVSTPENKPSA